MSPAQHPIGSGFGAESTAAEVIAGLDLSDRLAVVCTGGYSGIGLEDDPSARRCRRARRRAGASSRRRG